MSCRPWPGSRTLLAAALCIFLAWQADYSFAAEKEPVIEGVRVETGVEGKVGVFIQLNDFFTAECFTIPGNPVRLFCDFTGAKLAKDVERRIDTGTEIVLRVRMGVHREPRKVRVVLDLNPAEDYMIDQLFVKKDNQYVLVVEPRSRQ